MSDLEKGEISPEEIIQIETKMKEIETLLDSFVGKIEKMSQPSQTYACTKLEEMSVYLKNVCVVHRTEYAFSSSELTESEEDTAAMPYEVLNSISQIRMSFFNNMTQKETEEAIASFIKTDVNPMLAEACDKDSELRDFVTASSRR